VKVEDKTVEYGPYTIEFRSGRPYNRDVTGYYVAIYHTKTRLAWDEPLFMFQFPAISAFWEWEMDK
jgi:hypothetical protein